MLAALFGTKNGRRAAQLGNDMKLVDPSIPVGGHMEARAMKGRKMAESTVRHRIALSHISTAFRSTAWLLR